MGRQINQGGDGVVDAGYLVDDKQIAELRVRQRPWKEWGELALIRRQLTERGVPLVNRECMAAQEKAERIAAAMERERQAA